MAKALGKSTHRLAAGLLAAAMLAATPVFAEETPQQFDAANAENRRHSEAESQLRNRMHYLRSEQAKALLQCRGAGSAAARNACAGNAGITLRPRGLDLYNQSLREQNSHNQILKGLGVHRVP